MTRYEKRALLAAILAFTNAGFEITGPRADRTAVRNLEHLKKHPHQTAADNMDVLCSHVMESGVLQACFEEEARGWAATIRRMKDEQVKATYPEMWALLEAPAGPAYLIFDCLAKCETCFDGRIKKINKYGRCRTCQAEFQENMTEAESAAYGNWSRA